MRKVFASLLSFLLLVVAAGSVAPLAVAQSNNTSYNTPWYFASDYGQWSILGQTANSYQWSPAAICTAPGVRTAQTFQPFATNAPVYIVDATPANSEVVTPSAVSITNAYCTLTLAPSNSHYSFQVRSGTAGLQEALNQNIDRGVIPALVLLDRTWFTQANAITGTAASTIIGAAVGDATVMLEDINTATPTYYIWTGSAYSATAAYWQNTAPTLAAGAAAGSGPTVANTAQSTAIAGTADVTTGTSTTTGTLFTETWPTNSGTTGSFQYAGTCTVTSIGANSFTAFTKATTYTGSHRVLTVTATSAPTASTAYVFTYNCK